MQQEVTIQLGDCCLDSHGLLPFNNGKTSDIFQAVGKTDDNKDRFTIFVSTGRIHGSASLITDIDTFSRQRRFH